MSSQNWQTKLPQIKGILFDIDGTLVTSYKKVSQRTQEVLQILVDQGYELGVATGRCYGAIANYILPFFPKNSLHIVDDGASVVTADGRYLYQQIVPSAVVKQVIKIAQAYKGVKVAFSQNHHRYYDDRFFDEIRNKDKWHKNMGKIDELQDWSTPSLVIYQVGKKLAQVLDSLQFDQINLTFFETDFGLTYTVRVAGTNKAQAAKIWGEQLGIKPEEILIFGDSKNDLEAMKQLGLAVAMGNGVLEVKRLADVVIKSNDHHGIARFVDDHLSGKI